MRKATFADEADLPLEVRGFEINTAQDVFVLTRSLDANLKQAIEAAGYVQRSDIVLSDGKTLDGWVKV